MSKSRIRGWGSCVVVLALLAGLALPAAAGPSGDASGWWEAVWGWLTGAWGEDRSDVDPWGQAGPVAGKTEERMDVDPWGEASTSNSGLPVPADTDDRMGWDPWG